MSSLGDIYDDESESERDFKKRGSDEEEEVDDDEDEVSLDERSSASDKLQEESESEHSGAKQERDDSQEGPEEEEDSEQPEESETEEGARGKGDADEESDEGRGIRKDSDHDESDEEDRARDDPGDSDRDRDPSENDDDRDVVGQNRYEHDDEDEDGYGRYGDREDYGDDPEGFEDEDAYDDEKARDHLDPEQPMGGTGSTGMNSAQSVCLIFCCCICIILALIGGAVLGAILVDNDSSFREVLGLDDEDSGDGRDCPVDGGGGVIDNPPEPFAQFECPEDNVPLEFRITFDARPGEVGLRVFDTFGINMWNFPERSFGSFALLLRENIFTLCLSPFQNYTLEIADTAENGLISNFGAEIFGSFSLLYADQPVTSYNGDCNTTTTVQECGPYCKCSYLLAVNASSGFCTTVCD